MLGRRTLISLVLWLSIPAAANAQDKQAPLLPSEVQALEGKLVQIHHDVNLLGANKPSPLHTQYLIMILEKTGAEVTLKNIEGKNPDVVIFGEMNAPPKLNADEAADVFLATVAKRRQQDFEKYQQARPKLQKDAAEAGARVIASAEVAKALGIHVTEAQMVQALDDRAQEKLKQTLPALKSTGQNISEIIDLLRDSTRANIYVNWRALEAAGVKRKAPINLDMSEITLSQALAKLLVEIAPQDVTLNYVVREGIIWISSDDDLKARR